MQIRTVATQLDRERADSKNTEEVVGEENAGHANVRDRDAKSEDNEGHNRRVHERIADWDLRAKWETGERLESSDDEVP